MSTSRTIFLRWVLKFSHSHNSLKASRNVCLGLGDQHQVPNIPCDRADQRIFLFHHLTYFHKLNAQAAAKLIRALIVNKDPSEPLFHYNDIIVVSNIPLNNQQVQQKVRRTKKSTNQNQSQPRLDQFQYSNQFHSGSSQNFSSTFVTDVRNKVNLTERNVTTTNIFDLDFVF